MKPISKVLIIVLSVLFVGSVAVNGYFVYKTVVKSTDTKSDSTTPESTDDTSTDTSAKIGKEYDLIGLMYDSGALAVASQNITTADYQVTFLAQNNTGVAADGFYLLGSSGVSTYWGKCVGVDGTIPTEWSTTAKISNSYNRSAITVTGIELLPFEECGGGYTKDSKAGSTLETFIGTVQHTKRPSPDIAYDYKMVLDTPFVDKYSQSGLNPSVSSVIISPANFDMLTTIEGGMAQKLTLTGYAVGGYAESTYFDIFSVIVH
ncbi:hypothetical protein M0R04_01880 [Candidatus Dojkabacteria bacterium]|jgi:hypothetical protein|nr:hypothetical protein [Candidatus Dojkabacteria bacterium]